MKTLSKMNLNELVVETRRIKARLTDKGLSRIERAALKAQLAIVTAHHDTRISGRMGAISLTPADVGSLAACLDDARSQGLGDDDTIDMMVSATGCDRAAVYDWMRANA